MPDYIFKDQSSKEEMQVRVNTTSVTFGITTDCGLGHDHTQQNKVLIFREEALQLARVLIDHFDPSVEEFVTRSIPLVAAVKIDTASLPVIESKTTTKTTPTS